MKKSLKYLLISVFLIASVFNLKTALAEIPKEVQIGGGIYPSIIIFPIGVIVLAIISILFYLIIHPSNVSKVNKKENPKKINKKKANKKKEDNKLNLNQKLSIFLEKKDKISSDKKKILKNYAPLVDSLKRSQKKLPAHELANRFSLLLRRFFKEFFEIEYEFTFNELEEELKKRKQKVEIIEFVRKLEAQYDQNISKEQLSDLIVKFEEILNEFNLVGVEKISDILKKEKREFKDMIIDGLDGSYERKKNKIIEYIRQWENSSIEKQNEIFDKIDNELASMLPSERKMFFKKVYDAYDQYTAQICPGTISFRNCSSFKKQMDYLKNKYAGLIISQPKDD